MSDAPADQITDFEHLTCRHVGGHEFRVLNRTKQTVSKVNVQDLTCNCEAMAYNQETERHSCKHVQYALFQAPKVRLGAGEQLVDDLASLIVELSDAADRATDAANEFDKALIDMRDLEAGRAASEEPGETHDIDDPVAEFEKLATKEGFDTDELDVWIDDEYGSLQLEIDGYIEDFDAWREFKEGMGFQYDGDNDRSYLKSDQFEEVFG